ncbi:[FeFe] hydrogenase H-cluster radical SAM maturase HydE [Desulfofundulus thermobenzoicus]|uniref:[FeFe] hydrogenase H-cluster radical SAM maturase HydE n=1 Tax=Desulfofundulus thermobenzoicus TaxID=29376 RepID=A0A6N7IM03_9FIRM|nr:[FeFe] hydrogenase H-cluster radical SAM maturase HydE [Desulfofundulus thermobenzoicus]MQL51006.1 [FeFe] hydrogenase H-cluster radical SAM maturase HydE [Desulfofundulus thermobenzoicus]
MSPAGGNGHTTTQPSGGRGSTASSGIVTILARALREETLSPGEIGALLAAGPRDRPALFAAADEMRRRHVGDDVHLRGIIEFSNYCRNNCLYCGLRRENRRVKRYRMEPVEITDAARQAVNMGFKTIVLQSGEDPYYNGDVLARIVSEIKELDAAVTLSVGDRRREEYELWRRAGADRYLLKHETADPELFARLRPGTTLSQRLKRLYWLRELGYQVGSGNMVGLPGQTTEILAADLLLLKELDVEMAGIGPFIPHPETPLGKCPPGDWQLSLKVLAVARLLLPKAHLPATTALGTVHPRGREMGLKCGANVVMPDATPLQYRAHYQIYPGKAGLEADTRRILAELHKMIHSLGRRVAADYGHTPKWENIISGRNYYAPMGTGHLY